jgi:hypothetical protein
MNLEFEKYVFKFYKDVLEYIRVRFEKQSTLEHDIQLLTGIETGRAPLSFEAWMALIYRSERKKIIFS